MSNDFVIGERLEAFIRAEVESGRFKSDSEVVRAGLQLLESREDERRRWVADIRGSIEQGRADGTLIPADQVFDRLEEKYRIMAKPVHE